MTILLRFSKLLVVAAALWVTACSSVDMGGFKIFGSDDKPPVPVEKPRGHAAQEPPAGPAIAAGDALAVETEPATAWAGKYEVSPEGMIAKADGSAVALAGLTLAGAEQRLSATLKKAGQEGVTVRIQIVNPSPVYILGEINSPGEFPYVRGITVAQLIHLAGGYTHRADVEQATISRQGVDTKIWVSMDNPIDILPGDIIQVPQRYF